MGPIGADRPIPTVVTHDADDWRSDGVSARSFIGRGRLRADYYIAETLRSTTSRHHVAYIAVVYI